MTQTALQAATAEPSGWLVLFSWGYGADLAYTTYTADLTVNAVAYTSLPEMSLTFGARRALGADGLWTIAMPAHLLPALRLARGRYWGDVDVTVSHVSPDDLANPVVRFRGRVSGTRVRKPNVVRIECRSIKDVLGDAQLGLLASREDNFWFGAEQTNAVNLATLTETGTVTALGSDSKPNRVTLSFNGSPESPNSNNRWRSGHLEVLGERIGVRKALGSSKYDLVAKPDSSWLNAAFTLYPGWDGTYEHARDYWDEQGVELIRTFTGYGYRMPNRDPTRQSR
ncbi:MAG: hypothetical protein AAGI54_04105 [Planctomycetota bacterium]